MALPDTYGDLQRLLAAPPFPLDPAIVATPVERYKTSRSNVLHSRYNCSALRQSQTMLVATTVTDPSPHCSKCFTLDMYSKVGYYLTLVIAADEKLSTVGSHLDRVSATEKLSAKAFHVTTAVAALRSFRTSITPELAPVTVDAIVERCDKLNARILQVQTGLPEGTRRAVLAYALCENHDIGAPTTPFDGLMFAHQVIHLGSGLRATFARSICQEEDPLPALVKCALNHVDDSPALRVAVREWLASATATLNRYLDDKTMVVVAAEACEFEGASSVSKALWLLYARSFGVDQVVALPRPVARLLMRPGVHRFLREILGEALPLDSPATYRCAQTLIDDGAEPKDALDAARLVI